MVNKKRKNKEYVEIEDTEDFVELDDKVDSSQERMSMSDYDYDMLSNEDIINEFRDSRY